MVHDLVRDFPEMTVVLNGEREMQWKGEKRKKGMVHHHPRPPPPPHPILIISFINE